MECKKRYKIVYIIIHTEYKTRLIRFLPHLYIFYLQVTTMKVVKWYTFYLQYAHKNRNGRKKYYLHTYTMFVNIIKNLSL